MITGGVTDSALYSQAALAEHRHQADQKRRRTRSPRSTLTDAIIDGRYRRYILGQ